MYAGEHVMLCLLKVSIYRGIYIYAEECKLLWVGMFARERKKDRERERQRETERALGYHSGGDQAAGCSEVSGGLGGEVLDAAGVTVFAEDVSVQRVAALVIPL